MKAVKIIVFIITCLPVFSVSAETKEFNLENGLKILVKEDHRSPVVVSQIWYKVGSSYERPGGTGISHALEHMMFKGTKKHPAGEFSRIISINGGRENAFTGDDYTAYFQTLEKSRLPISFELEADRMRNLSLPKQEFQKEIEVVKEERRLRTEDNPQAYTYETTMATAFQTSPYRNPTIGWMSDLDKMQVTELRDWYKQWYAPNNATIVVVGDVDAEDVYGLVKKYFTDLAPEKVASPYSQPEVIQTGIKRITVKRSAQIPYLIMAYKTPVLSSINRDKSIPAWEPYALEVLAGILDGGNSARFASNLVRGKEIATSLNAQYQLTARLDSLFMITGVPAKDRTVTELEEEIRKQLSGLRDSVVDKDELARVKAQVISSNIYERDSIFYQAMLLGMFETVGLSWKQVDQYVERVQEVTAEQVQAVARKYLVDDGLTVAVLDPQPATSLTNDRLAARGQSHAH